MMKRNSKGRSMPDFQTQFKVVKLILDKRTEDALNLLSSFYNIAAPEIKVGTVKGKRKTVYAVYVGREGRIYALNSDILYNPFIVLHEFYHHLRSRGTEHRGSEDHANKYAKQFLHSYVIYRNLNPQAVKQPIASQEEDLTSAGTSQPTAGKTIRQLYKLDKERQD